MLKKLFPVRILAIIALAASSTACVTLPQHVQSTVNGALLGGAFGGIAGGDTRSAKRGAIAGGALGMLLSPAPAAHAYPAQPAYGHPAQPQQRRPTCRTDSYWDGYGCRLRGT